MPDRPLAGAERRHLEQLSGPLGIWQHARGVTPDPAHGTCTDDVARALTVDLLQRRQLGWEAVRPTARRSMAFLAAALDPVSGTFRNLRDADGAWLETVGSQDSQGRAMLALGIAAAEAPEVSLRLDARSLFSAALPGAARLTSLRAVASTILGCDAAMSGGMTGEVERTSGILVGRLRRAFEGLDLDGDWPWPEPVVTYENALLPHALIVAGRRLAEPDCRRVGLVVLDWLIAAQTTRRGIFSPVGNDGWWPRGGARSQFDQQPIEATALILAAVAAFEVTQDAGYVRAAEAAYGWFLGDNDGAIAVADVASGGCHDGLSPAGVNGNQGAESTLMWLTALEVMRGLRAHAASTRARRPAGRVAILAGGRS